MAGRQPVLPLRTETLQTSTIVWSLPPCTGAGQPFSIILLSVFQLLCHPLASAVQVFSFSSVLCFGRGNTVALIAENKGK